MTTRSLISATSLPGNEAVSIQYLFPSSNRPPAPNETGILPALDLSENVGCIVIRKSGLPSSAVSVALLSLEMKRLVRQLPGKLFVKNR